MLKCATFIWPAYDAERQTSRGKPPACRGKPCIPMVGDGLSQRMQAIMHGGNSKRLVELTATKVRWRYAGATVFVFRRLNAMVCRVQGDQPSWAGRAIICFLGWPLVQSLLCLRMAFWPPLARECGDRGDDTLRQGALGVDHADRFDGNMVHWCC